MALLLILIMKKIMIELVNICFVKNAYSKGL